MAASVAPPGHVLVACHRVVGEIAPAGPERGPSRQAT
jgi:hypothetical protein